MKIIDTMQAPSTAQREETRLTLANAQALGSRAIENLIGDELARVPEVDVDTYLLAALADELEKSALQKGA
jgi:O-methyltransferase involved in polyketide biosynthesis